MLEAKWMAFNILIERISFLLKFGTFFKNNCLSIYESMSFLKLEIGLMDSLWRHGKDSEDIYITIFGNISLSFSIDFFF